jgi:hypothetical protein
LTRSNHGVDALERWCGRTPTIVWTHCMVITPCVGRFLSRLEPLFFPARTKKNHFSFAKEASSTRLRG